ncbi:MAG: type II toxin-antitoxin system RelE family toxin [Desulfomonilaceae bacterium]
MPHYVLKYRQQALKQISKLLKDQLPRIVRKLEALQTQPYPNGCKKLSCGKGMLRLRSGGYRILYQVDSEQMTVTRLLVSDRKDAYRNI